MFAVTWALYQLLRFQSGCNGKTFNVWANDPLVQSFIERVRLSDCWRKDSSRYSSRFTSLFCKEYLYEGCLVEIWQGPDDEVTKARGQSCYYMEWSAKFDDPNGELGFIIMRLRR